MLTTKYPFFAFLCISILLIVSGCKHNADATSNLNHSDTITLEANKPTPFKDYYASGILKTEGQLIDHKKTGKWISYYENGEPKSINHYKDNERDGYQKIDYSQVLYMEGYSKNGLKVGIWKSHFKDDNRLKYVKVFDDEGNATGEWNSYYDSGELFEVQNFKNNKAHGTQITYFKNGNISTIGEKQEGREQGMWKYYNDTGVLVAEKTFDQGVEQ